jgi:nitrite reductase/ring-hydroxylating ferredoxin subunit
VSNLVDVGAVDDFPDDKPVVVSVKGRQLVVVRHNEQFYAMRNVCPHQLASFAAGWVTPEMCAASPDDFRYDDAVPVIHCPRHSWGYRLTDGISTADPSMRVRTFTTACDDGGRVLVDLGRGAARPRAAGVAAAQSDA